MDKQQEEIFWETINTFDKAGLLRYVMLIGSWAEYIYSYYFTSNFTPSLRTTDLDFLYKNIRKPQRQINIISKLTQDGFVYKEDFLTGVGKFFKEGILEIEFLTRSIGKGSNTVNIQSIGITVESLREVNMLADFPLELECRDYIVTVPEPAAYVLHKLSINPMREPEKQSKDIRAIRELLKHINANTNDKARLKIIFDKLFKKQQKIILETADKNFIELM